MIYLFTDFGYQGPYVGEVHAVFKRRLPAIPVIDLMHDAPAFHPRASSYLLAALAQRFQTGDVCLGVVDPGVGLRERRAVFIEADGIIYCGPDNGLFSQIVRRAKQVNCREIHWDPARLSDSFHGRDLFAPMLVAYLEGAQISASQLPVDELQGRDWPAETQSVIYFDQFGNAVTGIRGDSVTADVRLQVRDAMLQYARTFATVPVGQAFWYVNSMGLVELAVNQDSAREKFSLSIESPVSVSNKTG